MGKRVVVALGGNALQNAGQSPTYETQKSACETTAKGIVDIIENGYEVVITHGNGPQVGNIVLQNENSDSEKTPAMPLHVCGSMTQGEIGYWLQQAIGSELTKRGIEKEVCTVVSQVVVDDKDSAFRNPTKPIGPFYEETEANKLISEKEYTMVEDSGRGWRRVVPSPSPIDIVEKKAIKTLVDNGFLTIAVGGGGIPVIKNKGLYNGIDAVIDKDLASEKLAELLDGDILFIITAVEQVLLNFNKPNQQALDKLLVEEIPLYIKEGHFAPGSMLPKIKAAMKFAQSKEGRKCIITSLDKAVEALHGKTGTVVY